MKALLAARGAAGRHAAHPRVPGLDTLPVATALVVIAQKLRAFAYVSAGTAPTRKKRSPTARTSAPAS